MKKLLVVTVLFWVLASACTRLPVFPANSLPMAPKPVVFVTSSAARGWLDCLNLVLNRHSTKKPLIRVAIDPIRVTATAPGTGLALPQELRPYVADALRRLNNRFLLVDTSTVTGVPNFWHSLSNVASVSEPLAVSAVTSHAGEPQIVLRGSVYTIQETKAASAEAELFGIGINGEVRCYDLGFEMELIDRESRVVISAKTFMVRFYGINEGASVFRIEGGELIDGNVALVRSPSLDLSIRYVVDFALAGIMREYASKKLNIDLAVCDQEIPGQHDNSRLPIQAASQPPSQTFSLRPNQRGEFCINSNSETEPRRIYLNIWQYSSQTTEVPSSGPVRTPSFPSSEIAGGHTTCFSPSILGPNTQTIRVEVKSERDNQLLGSATHSFGN